MYLEFDSFPKPQQMIYTYPPVLLISEKILLNLLTWPIDSPLHRDDVLLSHIFASFCISVGQFHPSFDVNGIYVRVGSGL